MTVVLDEVVPARAAWARVVEAGQALRIVDLGGNQAVDFLVYNDNEEVFSTQVDFVCWEDFDLLDISGLFGETFLETTNHNPNEIAPTSRVRPVTASAARATRSRTTSVKAIANGSVVIFNQNDWL